LHENATTKNFKTFLHQKFFGFFLSITFYSWLILVGRQKCRNFSHDVFTGTAENEISISRAPIGRTNSYFGPRFLPPLTNIVTSKLLSNSRPHKRHQFEFIKFPLRRSLIKNCFMTSQIELFFLINLVVIQNLINIDNFELLAIISYFVVKVIIGNQHMSIFANWNIHKFIVPSIKLVIRFTFRIVKTFRLR
jgi:hypothetical protein